MAKPLNLTKTGALNINFTVQVWKENGTYVAYAPELDVSTCADSLRQAKVRLREADLSQARELLAKHGLHLN